MILFAFTCDSSLMFELLNNSDTIKIMEVSMMVWHEKAYLKSNLKKLNVTQK